MYLEGNSQEMLKFKNFGEVPALYTARNIRRVKIFYTVSSFESLFSLIDKTFHKKTSVKVHGIYPFVSSLSIGAIFRTPMEGSAFISCFVLQTEGSRTSPK